VILAHEVHHERSILERGRQHALERDLFAGGLIERRKNLAHATACQLSRQAVAASYDLGGLRLSRASPFAAHHFALQGGTTTLVAANTTVPVMRRRNFAFALT
jgi:hypothetical protein